MRKPTITGIVASIGVMLLPRHQSQKESHCDWYKRAVDSLTHTDNWREARLERPDFRRRRLTVSTCEGSGHGRLRETDGSGVGAEGGPTVVVPGGVGSAGGGGRRTRTSPARGGGGGGGDQSHGEIWGLSDSGHHPVDQIERWERVYVEMIPRVAEGVFEDGLRVWNQ